MKNSAAGAKKSPGTIVLWVLLCWAGNAHAEAIRRAWFYEGLVSPPETTGSTESRHQVGVSASSYPGAFSTKASAFVDLGLFELGFIGAQRFFMTDTPEGLSLQSAFSQSQRNVGLEIARYHVSPRGLHGRLALALLSTLPEGLNLWKLTISTGIVPTEAVPYELRLALGVLLDAKHKNDSAFVMAETWRRFLLGAKTSLQVGGQFTWSLAITVPDTSVVHEHLLFQIGPLVGLKSSWGRLVVGAPLRVWIDKNGSGGFLSDFASPAVSASLNVQF